MLLLEMIETIGAIWLAMSAVGFILFAIFGKPRQRSVAAIGPAESAESMSPAHAPAADRQVDKLRAMLDVGSDKSERDRGRDALNVPVDAE